MKMAFKQMKKEDSKSKYRSVIIHGLSTDVEDDYKDRLDEIESAIEDVLEEANQSGRDFEINEFVVLGKLGENERAPPVLVRLKNENDSTIVLKGKNRLRKSKRFESVYITPDLDTAERKERRELQEKLKNKIKEFPDKHWVIRNSQVTSEGEHSKRVEVDVAE